MLKAIFVIGITLQLAATVLPALSAETPLPARSAPIPPATQAPAPRSAKRPQRLPADTAQRQVAPPNGQTPLLERDRLILERYLIRVIPKTSR
ncbi:hypothetical protein H6F76_25255 [Leptolyngbya sp. FACHB-321]|uniref:hypothetical protein n=1 Tax=Leptolyngbya sp. FACHB-321 TaxID=2692807 RepID=UPI00168913E5|nr:hypothetical protein [Leptolyngbya sp. FACHB-321]MBD2038265.1 hypothetical protein [Leptolyngbya sp. FACHB-321]